MSAEELVPSSEDYGYPRRSAQQVLGEDSYTVKRLQHASSEHVHLTTRRCFVGPIPDGWLKSHRKEWYKHYLGIHHASKAPTFSTTQDVGSHRRMTGIDSQQTGQSFPQPADALDGAAGSTPIGAFHQPGDGTAGDEALVSSPPAVSIPRSGRVPKDNVLKHEVSKDQEQPISSLDRESADQLRPDPPVARQRTKPIHQSRHNQRTMTTSSASSYKTAKQTLTEMDAEALVEPETDDAVQESSQDARDPPSGIEVVRTGPVSPKITANTADSLNIQGPTSPVLSGRADSTTSLLPPDSTSRQAVSGGNTTRDIHLPAPAMDKKATLAGQDQPDTGAKDRKPRQDRPQVQFNLTNERSRRKQLQQRARMAHVGLKTQGRTATPSAGVPGEIVRIEKMLLRVDLVIGTNQPDADFVEKDSLRVETRVLEKWREFMVVCRNGATDGAPGTLQIYSTRVIPASDRSHVKKRFKHEVLLDPSKVRVNLYSSLDKTIAVCTREGPSTKIFFLRTRSGTSSVEWYHELRSFLGLRRARTIQVNIPDLNANIRIENPFDHDSDDTEDEGVEPKDDAIQNTQNSQIVRKGTPMARQIVNRCLQILTKDDEWADILESWSHHERVALAWKRYDRLEWIYGEHERRMYGANAMLRTHQLELRTKQHYPEHTKTHSGKDLYEPAPVEGFLIRLTSQKGVHQKMGKYFYKRLYYSTHNQFLVFVRPVNARPPPPPSMPMTSGSDVPSVDQLSGKLPLIYAVNPFPYHDGSIPWLDSQDRGALEQHDIDAADEETRAIYTLHNSDGFINLCDVVKVRKLSQEAIDEEDGATIGSDVDYDIDAPDTAGEDGSTSEVDVDRTFELVLRNGLVIRLQAFNRATKSEWIKRLRDLVRYWTRRVNADMDLFRSVRTENLKALNIDERAEAYVGQFAQKWEVSKSFASPELYNMCGLANCRAVHVAGELFRKPRPHSTFNRCHVILCRGHLLIYQHALRSGTGRRVPHTHHDRTASIDLSECYLYSGLLTESDLGGAGSGGGQGSNRAVDVGLPGSNALPRMYPEDRWISTDEDAMTTFVLWHGQRKGWFRSKETDEVRARDGDGGVVDKTKTKLKRVNALGVKGRSVVFKARSRAERDHWVLAIAAEIEMVAKDDGVRIEDSRG